MRPPEARTAVKIRKFSAASTDILVPNASGQPDQMREQVSGSIIAENLLRPCGERPGGIATRDIRTLAARHTIRAHPTANENNVTEDDVLAFIANSIGSVWALELLLLLKRDTGRGWEAEALVRELRSSPVVIAEALGRLQNAGLVMQRGPRTFQYHAASPLLDDVASEIVKVYAIKPMTVIRAIVDPRTDKLRAFSDAFKLKD
jgi:hypothetical protein